jgi:hypothetical protein
MLRDLLYQVKRKEVRMGIILVSIFILGVVNIFTFTYGVDALMLLLLVWGMGEVISGALFEDHKEDHKNH